MPDAPTIPLLPCPWCGSESVRLSHYDQDSFISCDDCGATGPAFNHSEPDKVFAAWNQGPYADREEVHQSALMGYAAKLSAEADRLRAKADELERKAKREKGPTRPQYWTCKCNAIHGLGDEECPLCGERRSQAGLTPEMVFDSARLRTCLISPELASRTTVATCANVVRGVARF